MPFGGTLVELVQDGLRLVDLSLAEIGVHLRIGGAHVVRRVPLAALGHDRVVRNVDPVEHARRLVARLAFQEAFFGILLFEFLVARGKLLVGDVFGHAQKFVIFFAHIRFLSACAVYSLIGSGLALQPHFTRFVAAGMPRRMTLSVRSWLK